MRFVKKTLLISGLLLVALQFTRPVHNKSSELLTTDVSKVLMTPDTVLIVLKNGCFDCHSNNTDYPWYTNVQPIGWLMAYHIKNAKEELNFSEFGSYSRRRQLSKLDGIVNSINDNTMPLKSYKILHKSAQLSKVEKLLLINWANQSIDSLSASKK